MLEEFEQSISEASEDDPAAHLDAILDGAFDPSTDGRSESAMVDLRAQGAHDDRYRELFTRHDRFFYEHLAAVVETGIEDGTFRDVDPLGVATFVFTVLEGLRVHRATSDQDTAEAVRAGLDAYLDAVLYPTD